ncbi:HD domain-containing protein [Planomicrobium okeanokoites]|uniref:HD domain-containing protein n=1 Tax=Planomicrobium okeanokoites TaxID=244 RepID=A0ABV7KPW4_PLAOK|nr:HD domain-containing protein [Planomicrobium okeanokoites]TAA71217.1 HD domain-containing protein [Planomicrobium okeanokoites]
MQKSILSKCKVKVKEVYDTFDASHDWQHIERVLANADRIMEKEAADPFIVELAILLHDVSDPKYKEGNSDPESEILDLLDLSVEQKSRITDIIRQVSFKGGNGEAPSSIEAKVVQDADRLDAIGAVGIARTFAYGGARGRKLYDWDEKPRNEMSEQEYRDKPTSSATHFYEKLLLLKNMMNTGTGRQIADERHQFMLSFLEQLKKETDGNA